MYNYVYIYICIICIYISVYIHQFHFNSTDFRRLKLSPNPQSEAPLDDWEPPGPRPLPVSPRTLSYGGLHQDFGI